MTNLAASLATSAVLLALSPPWEGGPITPPRIPRKPDYEKRDPILVREQVGRIVKLVSEIDEMPLFSKGNVEALVGVSMTRSRSNPPYPNDYEGELASGPFGRVSLHHSGPGKKSRFWIVSLVVRDGVALRRKDFDEKFIGPHRGTNPNDLSGATYIHSIDRPGKTTLFVFDLWTGLLRGVGFHRGTAAKKQ